MPSRCTCSCRTSSNSSTASAPPCWPHTPAWARCWPQNSKPTACTSTVVLSAEGLALGEYDRIAHAFNAKVRHGYAATESFFISYSCAHG